mgnify:CR=1 FL=1
MSLHDTPRADFGSEFDRRLAQQGAGALFTCDADGELRLADDRTRELHDLVPEPHTLQWRHCLYRDRATGYVQYILVTSPELCATHPRADIAHYDSQQQAFAVLDSLGVPPVFRGAWPR